VRADLALASGETLRRGDGVSFVHAALNLDDETFSRPSRYDVERPAAELRRHAGFGLGVHRCAGWRLGLVAACEAVQAVLRACPRLRLAPGYTPEWKSLDSLHCLTALHVCG